MTTRRISGEGEVYRAATELAVDDENSAEHIRRRAARWHAWLKSPECTFQDRENFERWCANVTNAAAYVAFCSDLAAVPECANERVEDDDDYCGPRAIMLPNSSQLDAGPREC